MRYVMRAVKPCALDLDATHYVMHKIFNRIFNNNFWYNIIVLVWQLNLAKEN